jgi:hypothetical protein
LQLNAVVYVGDGRSREVIRAFEFGGNFAMPGCNVSAGGNRSRPYSFEVRCAALFLCSPFENACQNGTSQDCVHLL